MLACVAVSAGYSQCVPDTAITNNFPLDPTGELEPDAFYAYPGQYLDLLVTALPPDEVDAGIGFNVSLNWVRITALQNAPTWLAWDCGGQLDPMDPCKMAYPTWTCVNAYATTPDGRVPLSETPGTQYTMDVIVDANVAVLGTVSGQNGGQLSVFILDSMIVDVTGNNPACGGNGTASAAPAGGFGDPGAYVYSWNTGQTTQTIANLGPGWYICTVTDQVTGWSAIDSVEIVSPSAIVINVDAQTDVISGNDGSASISASGGTGTLTYSWTGPNGFTSTSEDISGLAPGLYTLTVTDAQGCSSIQSVNILSQVGVEGNDLISLRIFPNPSNGVLNIEGLNNFSDEATINIYDAQGQRVYTEAATGNEFRSTIDMTSNERGMYSVEVISGNSRSIQQIVIR